MSQKSFVLSLNGEDIVPSLVKFAPFALSSGCGHALTDTFIHNMEHFLNSKADICRIADSFLKHPQSPDQHGSYTRA